MTNRKGSIPRAGNWLIIKYLQNAHFYNKPYQAKKRRATTILNTLLLTMSSSAPATFIEVILNDRLGKKIQVKCSKKDTIGQLKKLISAQTGTKAEKIVLKKWYNIYKDHITLEDYEIGDGFCFELYYQ